jgi:hypothetical protein
MYGHWFVLGSQFNTKIFTQAEDKLTLRVVKVLNNPLGRERSRNLHGKKPVSIHFYFLLLNVSTRKKTRFYDD